jgi:nicotinamidase-related amidase
MSNTALLVMDPQNGVLERVAARAETVLSTLGRAIGGARTARMPVIYVILEFRAGAPEISPRNRTLSALGRSGEFETGGTAAQIHAAVAPAPDDIVVTRRRVGAFTGGDLDVVLRAQDVEALVLTGISTSGVVLSTLRQAADLDYALTVLRDGCADRDDEVHRVLLEKVFPRQATVVTTDEWLASLPHASPG